MWLGAPSAVGARILPPGFVVGIGRNGKSRWLQEWRPCYGFSKLVKCDGFLRHEADDSYVHIVTKIELIDLTTGVTKAWPFWLYRSMRQTRPVPTWWANLLCGSPMVKSWREGFRGNLGEVCHAALGAKFPCERGKSAPKQVLWWAMSGGY